PNFDGLPSGAGVTSSATATPGCKHASSTNSAAIERRGINHLSWRRHASERPHRRHQRISVEVPMKCRFLNERGEFSTRAIENDTGPGPTPALHRRRFASALRARRFEERSRLGPGYLLVPDSVTLSQLILASVEIKRLAVSVPGSMAA